MLSGRENQGVNTRHPERPPRKPGRLDQFADDIYGDNAEIAEELGVTGRKETRRVRALTRPHGRAYDRRDQHGTRGRT